MQRNQRFISYILVLIAAAAWIVMGSDGARVAGQETIAAPQVGFKAPDFTLPSVQGELFTLSDLQGKAVLINLWATWCRPCREEMPVIEKLAAEYRSQGLLVLGLNMTYQDDISRVASFVEEYKLSFPILLDETGQAARAYQLRSLPSTYFIDREGRIRDVVIGGPMSEPLLRSRIENILQ